MRGKYQAITNYGGKMASQISVFLRPILQAVFILGSLMVGVTTTSATVYEFDVLGTASVGGESSPLGYTKTQNYGFNMYFNEGDVVLSYNDLGTADIIDDIVTIAGLVPTRIIRPFICGKSCNFESFGNRSDNRPYNTTLQWDIEMTNPISGDGNPLNGFSFDQQNGGTISVYDPNTNTTSRPADVLIKRDKTFAFLISPFVESQTIPGLFTSDGEGWVQLGGGFLPHGNYYRAEFSQLFNPNPNINWDLRLQARLPHPPTEVPEPMTVTLLLTALLGGAATRQKK